MEYLASLIFSFILSVSGAVADVEFAAVQDSEPSVELGLEEFSPRGEEGGYAIPASGNSLNGSYTCRWASFPTPPTVEGQNEVVTIYAHTSHGGGSWNPLRVERRALGENWATIWEENTGSHNYSKSVDLATAGLEPGTYEYRYLGYPATGGSINCGQDDVIVIPDVEACRNTWDDDGDGLDDYPDDPGCSSSTDDDEYNPPPTATIEVCDLGGGNCVVGPGVKPITTPEEVELHWSSTVARSCSFTNFDGDDGDGDPTTAGDDTTVAEPTGQQVRTYSIDCAGATAQVSVSNGATAAVPPTITINGPEIVRTGTEVEVCWDDGGSYPNTCTLTGPGLTGTSAATGCKTIDVTYSSQFSITCPAFPTESVSVRVAPTIQEN